MLVLSRKSLESVVVGGSGRFEHMLKVTVLEIKNGSVRLGFEADASVPVHRSEVWERISREQRSGWIARQARGGCGGLSEPRTNQREQWDGRWEIVARAGLSV